MHVSEVEFALNPINPFGIGMEPVKAQLVLHPKPNHQARCQSDGQTCQIYQGIQLIPKKVPQCDLEVVLQHISLLEIS
jgi:hypothetical protein